MDDDLERWRCAVCRQLKPVPVLARDCERKHAEEAKQQAEQESP